MSGGTVALVTGVYEVLLGSLAHLSRAARAVLSDGLRGRAVRAAREHAAQVPWRQVVPLALGMVCGVVAGARALGPLLDEHPAEAGAILTGLVLGAVAAPVRMIRGAVRWPHAVLGAAAALAVSVAVCASCCQGVSAAFLLLTVGLYEPTLDAVNEADVGYLAAVVAGGLLGLGVWAALVGSLRALWPWQGPDRQLQPPQEDVVPRALLALAAFLLLLALVGLEQRRRSRDDREPRCRSANRSASSAGRREPH